MNKFKVGDKVRYIEKQTGTLIPGEVYVVSNLRVGSAPALSGVYLEGFDDTHWWYHHRFELAVEKEQPVNTPKPHKHADLIKQWADNPKLVIQYRAPNVHDDWRDCGGGVGWIAAYEYRIKPEPKPDRVIERHVQYVPSGDYFELWTSCYKAPNMQFTFDGETGKIKAAEIIS